jgi:apolipoprotein D and lipocalin family protein
LQFIYRYLGKWYEITRFDFLFEKDLTCVTAEYGAINGTHISVRNAGKNM